ncbi:MAG: radical SAM protein, partial [Chitinophagales bacterium]|nr:radical SAM protein [Chitinophagales bacterium]
MAQPKRVPNLVYSDGSSIICDDPNLLMSGRSGFDAVALEAADFIELPEGSDLFELPGRLPIGFDKKTGALTLCDKGV